MRILFLTLFSEGRGDRLCGNYSRPCFQRGEGIDRAESVCGVHLTLNILAIHASGILRTPSSLFTLQAFRTRPSRYLPLRHSAHSLLAIHASGILRTPCSQFTPLAFCALPARYPRLRHSAYALLVIPASGIPRTPFSLSPPQAFCALPHKSAHNPASSSLRLCVCGHHTPHDTPAVG